jgi:outer membrane protein OmpA-like peptidoglycan-associated protein
LTVSADALFDPDEWEMTPEAEPLMSQLGRLLAKAGSNRVTIEAYTSSDRLPRYNRRLSEMRAQAVKNWLFEHQLVSTSTRIKGFALEPIGTTETSDLSEGIESRNKVEVVIQTCG